MMVQQLVEIAQLEHTLALEKRVSTFVPLALLANFPTTKKDQAIAWLVQSTHFLLLAPQIVFHVPKATKPRKGLGVVSMRVAIHIWTLTV